MSLVIYSEAEAEFYEDCVPVFLSLNDPYIDGTIEYWWQFILPFSDINPKGSDV